MPARRFASPCASHSHQLEAPRRVMTVFKTCSRSLRCLLGFRRGVASATSATIAMLIWSGLVAPVGGEEGAARPTYDRAVLSEIARDVLRRGATGTGQSVPEPTAPGAEPAHEFAGVGTGLD